MVDDPAAEHELRIRIESLSMKLAEIDGRMLYKGLSEAERAKLEREYF